MSSSQVWALAVGALLIILAALLVAAETAIGRVSRGAVEQMRRDGLSRADSLAVVAEDRPRYLNVLLFLSTVATVSAVALVADVSLTTLHGELGWPVTGALALGIAVMVLISYVVLGVAARTLGVQHANRIALRAARPARLIAGALSPLANLLILLGNALTPGRGFRAGPFASEAELRELVDLAQENSLIEDDERQMIHSVFELGDTYAREVMVPRTEVVFIERDKTLRQALSLGLRSGFSRIPVIGDSADDVAGIVYLKDVVRRVFDHREAEQGERVESIMRAPYFVPDSKQADELLRQMQAARVHLAIVVDEYGGTAGLLTIEDILEEIVGEIDDEYDTAAPEVASLDDGRFRVSARMNVDDFADLIELDIDGDEEGVDSVLGLMAKRLGRVPIPGASIDIDGWILMAEQGAGRRNRIGTVLAKQIAAAPEGPEDD
ncbi:MAG: hemolysin family protein [Candidatus Nanopelagicales bacterium]|nr:hemolysin family protein [Candidatus Nanopelagicales bacterium]MDP4887493.1 hemolysin family protein [Candidatus Nanopelagicales bacterium]